MMKFNKFIYWLKKDKVYLALFVTFCICVLIDLSVIIFDVIEIIKTSTNAASLSNIFLALNIITIIINFIFMLFLVLVIVLKKNK